MKKYEIQAYDVSEPKLCESVQLNYGNYSSVEEAIEAIQNPEGELVQKLLGGEGWMLGEPSLRWSKDAARVTGAQVLIKDVRWPHRHQLMFVVKVEEREVRDGQ